MGKGFLMFKNLHHQRILKVLQAMDVDLLKKAECYFGGGTAIALQLNEYRESVDIDFLCASQNGYRVLRERVFDKGFQGLFIDNVNLLRDTKTDSYRISNFIVIDGQPIKLEILNESRIKIEPDFVRHLPVPCLSKVDLFAEKLLANADRFSDKSVMSRDVIDLLVMEHNWGKIPKSAWEKSENAYGNYVHVAFEKAKDFLKENPAYLSECISKMSISSVTAQRVRVAVGVVKGNSLER